MIIEEYVEGPRLVNGKPYLEQGVLFRDIKTDEDTSILVSRLVKSMVPRPEGVWIEIRSSELEDCMDNKFATRLSVEDARAFAEEILRIAAIEEDTR